MFYIGMKHYANMIKPREYFYLPQQPWLRKISQNQKRVKI